MSASHLNITVIEGRLTRDPEVRGGGKVAAFSLASNRWFYKDDERVEETVFIDVTAFGHEAKHVIEKLSKGSLVTVQGRLELNRWTAEDGSNRQALRLIAQSVRGSSMSGSQQSSDESAAPSQPVQERELVGATAASESSIPF